MGTYLHDAWVLDKDRGDATVEDICDFIAEYISVDVIVHLRLCLVLVLLRSFLPAICRASRHRNC
jgi:hypothetical protein